MPGCLVPGLFTSVLVCCFLSHFLGPLLVLNQPFFHSDVRSDSRARKYMPWQPFCSALCSPGLLAGCSSTVTGEVHLAPNHKRICRSLSLSRWISSSVKSFPWGSSSILRGLEGLPLRRRDSALRRSFLEGSIAVISAFPYWDLDGTAWSVLDSSAADPSVRMADDERIDITDISNSPAFVALNELLADGTLTAAQVTIFSEENRTQLPSVIFTPIIVPCHQMCRTVVRHCCLCLPLKFQKKILSFHVVIRIAWSTRFSTCMHAYVNTYIHVKSLERASSSVHTCTPMNTYVHVY